MNPSIILNYFFFRFTKQQTNSNNQPQIALANVSSQQQQQQQQQVSYHLVWCKLQPNTNDLLFALRYGMSSFIFLSFSFSVCVCLSLAQSIDWMAIENWQSQHFARPNLLFQLQQQQKNKLVNTEYQTLVNHPPQPHHATVTISHNNYRMPNTSK